jgi:hypothetical protein
MSEAVVSTPRERMTWEQICAAYEGEWVLMVDVDWPEEDIDPRSGVVVAHGKRRLYGLAKELVPNHTEITHLFIFPPEYLERYASP